MASLGETFVELSELYHCHVLFLRRHYLGQRDAIHPHILEYMP